MQKIEKELPNALLGWYPFEEDASILWITSENVKLDGSYSFFADRNLNISKCKPDEIDVYCEKYDYIILLCLCFEGKKAESLLKKLCHCLRQDGKLLLAADNRFGIRYFCGDKDPYTGHVLDGIDHYAKVNEQRREGLSGRAYSKAELQTILDGAGFQKCRFYSVMPALERPQLVMAEGYIPNELLDIRIFPQYNSPQTVFLEEEKLYDDLLQNGLFHTMANGFLVECTVGGALSDAEQITVSGDRGHGESLITIIKKNDYVWKKALYREGKEKLAKLAENTAYLQSHNIPVVEGQIEGDMYVMPYVHGEIATEHFRKLLRRDPKGFLEELGQFFEVILRSSEQVPYEQVNWQRFDPEWSQRKADDPNLYKWEKLAGGSEEEKRNIGVILKRGYIDLVSLNCFWSDKEYLFFDQEFYCESLPVNVIFVRNIDLIYGGFADLEEILSKEEVLKHFSLWEHKELWRQYTHSFMRRLRNEKELAAYHKRVRRDMRIVVSNRHRMDYTQEEYDRLFTNIFRNVNGKKIFLFGSGRFAEQFVKQFQDCCEIAGIVDNNSEKWGTKLEGIEICSPMELKAQQAAFKVFICIKFFDEVLEQLRDMGIREISVYNPALEYDRPLKLMVAGQQEENKRYHVGYVAGVFDLFHIGHLNLLKRAKEQCDYLIVGVVSDEQVIRDKRTSPYVPFEERKEIVQSCKYVDEAVRIPEDHPGTEEAYRRYHFDVQFSGSDYENDPDWMAKREYLRQHGAELVFFPYTQSTSSTKLKEKISH